MVPGQEWIVAGLAVAAIVIAVLLLVIREQKRTNAESRRENARLSATLREQKSRAAESELIQKRRIGGLESALNRSERNARESEATLKKQIERLKHETANLLEVPPEQPLRKMGAKTRLAVPPDEAARVACEDAARAERSARGVAALQTRLDSLRLRARCDSHFIDSVFQQEYAKSNAKEILEIRKTRWGGLYRQFMKDAPLKKLAEEQAPEVIQWLEARVKIVQLAEGLRIAPPAHEVEAVVMTDEEIRAAKLRKHADEHDHRIALAKLKGEKAAEADAALESLSLNADLKDRLRTELTDEILDDEGEHEGRKHDVTL